MKAALSYWALVFVSVFFICTVGSCSLGFVQRAQAADIEAAGMALDPLVEYRWCGPPARSESGVILRSSAVRAAFRQTHPCPATGLRGGACPEWSIDHVWPLSEGGCDIVINLQWLPNAIKSCALSTGVPCKDRWERRVYGPTNLP